MQTRVSKESVDEKDRCNSRFVLRGYAELTKRVSATQSHAVIGF